jgi:small subunit ribosomal protein S13
MLYIFESELSENKSLLFALKNIYGIGNYKALLICKQSGFSSNLKVSELTSDQVIQLLKVLELLNLSLPSDIKKSIQINNLRLFNIKSTKGIRKAYGLPVRGQRTHTNAKTAKKRKS